MEIKTIWLIIMVVIVTIEVLYSIRGNSVLKWRNECREMINHYNLKHFLKNNYSWIYAEDVMKSMNEVYFKFWINGKENMLKPEFIEMFDGNW